MNLGKGWVSNKKIKCILTGFLSALTLVFGIVSKAAIGGTWKGWGDWTYEGSGTHCSDVGLVFSESIGEISRVSGYFKCDVVSSELTPLTLKKEGSNLIYNGKVVGHFTDSEYAWDEAYSEKVRIKVTILKEGRRLTYKEEWFDSHNAPLYQVSARLFGGS